MSWKECGEHENEGMRGRRKEGRKGGRKEGREEGRKERRDEGMNEGKECGGHGNEGRKDGRIREKSSVELAVEFGWTRGSRITYMDGMV